MTEKETTRTSQWGFLEFDPMLLVRDVAKRWLLILLVVALVSMSAFVYGTVSYKPNYQTSITYVTYTRSSGATVYNNLSSAIAVVGVFEELLNSSLLRNTILSESGMDHFDGQISARVIAETNLLTVTISGEDPHSVFCMARAIVEHHEAVTYQVIDNVSLELLRSPTVPMAPSNLPEAEELAKKAAILAAVAMVALLGFLSARKDVVRSGSEAVSKLDCGYLGDVPHEAKYKTWRAWLRRRQTNLLVTNPVTSLRFVETFRKLASRVEYHMHGEKVIMVTSVQADEGKSAVAVNLAMSMALKHENVLLVDCDMRNPSVENVLGTKHRFGISDFLEGRAEFTQIGFVSTEYSNFAVIPAGRAQQNASEKMGTDRMKELLEQARAMADYVILDCAPSSFLTDAAVMAQYADAALMVVRCDYASRDQITGGVESMADSGVQLLGCVLNDLPKGTVSGGGYYGTYGYGSYGSTYGTAKD
jgi:capsular exopolysaccharide synthesis family protein